MNRADELLRQYVEALAAEGCDTGDFEAELIGAQGRLRKRRDREIAAKQAADLLCQRVTASDIAERQGCNRSTVYRRLKYVA